LSLDFDEKKMIEEEEEEEESIRKDGVTEMKDDDLANELTLPEGEQRLATTPRK